MRALCLSTRYQENAFEGSACLLVYDEIELTGSTFSSDVRDLLDAKPNTSWIYVLAPYQSESLVVRVAHGEQVIGRAGEKVGVLSYRAAASGVGRVVKLTRGESGLLEEPLPAELQHGWLFDLFDKSKGKVTAPPGVHFGKASSKHARAFLRASNAILSTKASGLLAFFLMAALPRQEVRRVLVDTAPMLVVAQALHRVAELYGFWTVKPPAMSFSSYGGLDALSSLRKQDLVVISASTSGGLASRLIQLGASEQLVVTLFSLMGDGKPSKSPVVCDLAFRPGRPFGYLPIENQTQGICKWCDQGYLLAPLEGDQFLLEKRPIKRLRISKSDQTHETRRRLERLTRKGYFKVDVHGASSQKTQIVFDADRAIQEDEGLRSSLIRLLRRYAPAPLDAVVLIGVQRTTYEGLIQEAGLTAALGSAALFDGGQVSAMPSQLHAGVLVLVGCLNDHALLRGVNAQLRTKAQHGCVTYLAAMTFADSNKNLADLDMFLSYGEHGKETFTFKSAESLLLPWKLSLRSPWDEERELLQRMRNDLELDKVLVSRLEALESAGSMDQALFLVGKNEQELKIAPDFVYLDTQHNAENISQADIFLVVSNLLAAARANGLTNGLAKEHHQWAQSVYGQVLIDLPAVCPRNLRDYNDSILRASFLRAANKEELNFSVDEECSGEVLDVLLAELAGWSDGRGDSLPEMLLALATGRLKLQPSDEARLIEDPLNKTLPSHLRQLFDAWVASIRNP